MDKKWYDNEISMGIMKRKYLHEGETPDDFIPRVASIFSKDFFFLLVEHSLEPDLKGLVSSV